MKQFLFFVIVGFMMLILLSCSPINNVPMTVEDDMTFEEEQIKYNIEQIIFSKSFQSTEPSVEVISNKNNVKILASLGLAEYSDIIINKIVKKGNIINIHVSGIKGDNPSLSVPQIIMELIELNINKDNITFNIVFDDYDQVKIKFGINDIINKIQSHFKIATNRLPTYNLLKEDNNIIWDISYKGVFDRENPILPLINLSILIDANSGEIIESEKTIVSSSLDHGHILDYVPEDYMLYKKIISNNDEDEKLSEQLWFINPLSKEKAQLYTTDYKIAVAQFNADKTYISLIETNEDKNDLYIISLEDKRVFKIPFKTKFNPRRMKWKDINTLYLLGNDQDTSTIYSYNLESNETRVVKKIDKVIDNLIINDDIFIVTEKFKDEINRNIYLTTDWDTYKLIDNGFNVKFLSDDLIAYLKKIEKNDNNFLFIYDLKNEEIVAIIEGNISNYHLFNDDELIYVNQNTNNADYTIAKYSISDKSTEDVTTIIGNRIYYDENNNIIYLNILLPFEDNKTEMIYSISVDKLNNVKNP